MDDAPHTVLIRKLQNNGMSPALAANEVEKALAMSPSAGAENLQKLGLDYLAALKVLSDAGKDDGSYQPSRLSGLFSVLFPWSLTRGEYLLRYVFVVLGLAMSLAYPAFLKVRGSPTTSVVPEICFVVLLVCKIGILDAARFRDREKPGFYAFFMILPVANLIAQFYLWIAR